MIFIAAGQPLFLSLMAMQTDYTLFAVSLLAMGFVFGQIPITDALLSQYVPDQWRTKVLSIKFLINLGDWSFSVDDGKVLIVYWAGFETVMRVIAIAACFIVGAAILLPKVMIPKQDCNITGKKGEKSKTRMPQKLCHIIFCKYAPLILYSQTNLEPRP
ncbi:MAG: hypothetical protein Ct9H300mP21_01000 [Pseudomonadota bacterium]|nr:MAG: hypothetical protein Ct9H300mP21_01000 [Pseudomonadota bacterium]